jgi:hypothetical protein
MYLNLKPITALLGVVAMLGCASHVAAASDWIEVPLSDNIWWEASEQYREADYVIQLAPGEALEHKLAMQSDSMVVYEWSVEMDNPAELMVEFHGHTEREGDEPGLLMFYKIHQLGEEAGTLRAPFTGIHGWYFNNTSADDIEIHLSVAGFFSDPV